MGQISVKVGHNQDPIKAIQKLKNKLIEEGLFAELKKRKHYVKPSKAKRLKREEAERTRVKDLRKAIRQAEQSDEWY
jgi:small subunit ribosomal protein S21|tara:strand:- start:179 stop:409 length:231 start_codon:yes stop_codon:yes gene_type:complete